MYRLAALVLAASLCFTATGCNTQQTAAQIIAVVGTSVASLETLEGADATLVAKIQADTATASQQVLNWKAGTPSADVIATLNLVEDDLNLFPISPTDQALVNLAIGTVEEIIILINPAPVAAPNALSINAAHRRSVPAVTGVKSKGDYKVRWNAIISDNAKLSAAKIK